MKVCQGTENSKTKGNAQRTSTGGCCWLLGLKVTSYQTQSKDMLMGELLAGGILMLSDATSAFDLIGQGEGL